MKFKGQVVRLEEDSRVHDEVERIPGPICCGWDGYSRAHFYEGWEIPWPMCKKEKYWSPCLGEWLRYSWAHVLVWVGGIFQCLV